MTAPVHSFQSQNLISNKKKTRKPYLIYPTCNWSLVPFERTGTLLGLGLHRSALLLAGNKTSTVQQMYFIILSSNHYIRYIRHQPSSNTFSLAQWRILHYTCSAKKENRFSCMRWLEQTAANIQWEEKNILSAWNPITSYMEGKNHF